MLRSRIASVSFSLVGGLALVGCGGGSGFSLVPASSTAQHNVMVIDEGFARGQEKLLDSTLATMAGLIAASTELDGSPEKVR